MDLGVCLVSWPVLLMRKLRFSKGPPPAKVPTGSKCWGWDLNPGGSDSMFGARLHHTTNATAPSAGLLLPLRQGVGALPFPPQGLPLTRVGPAPGS